MVDKERARKLIHEAARILAKSGNVREINDMAYHASNIFGDGAEDDFDIIYLDCAVCGDYHNCSIEIKRSKFKNYQYVMEINIKHNNDLSILDKIKRIWNVLFGDHEENDFLLDEDAMWQLRDLFRRMEIEEEKIAMGSETE